eukprot:gene19556-12436_t
MTKLIANRWKQIAAHGTRERRRSSMLAELSGGISSMEANAAAAAAAVENGDAIKVPSAEKDAEGNDTFPGDEDDDAPRARRSSRWNTAAVQELAAPKSAKPTRIKALTKLERNALYLNTIYKSPKPVMMAHVWPQITKTQTKMTVPKLPRQKTYSGPSSTKKGNGKGGMRRASSEPQLRTTREELGGGSGGAKSKSARRPKQSIDHNGLFTSSGALFRCDMAGNGVEGHMTISTSGLTPTMRRQWEAQQTSAMDERRKMQDPRELAKIGVFKWDRNPHYQDPITEKDPLRGRTLMHLSDQICEEYMVPETERIGGLDRTARIVARQENTYTHSPYSIGARAYGSGYKAKSPSPIK